MIDDVAWNHLSLDEISKFADKKHNLMCFELLIHCLFLESFDTT